MSTMYKFRQLVGMETEPEPEPTILEQVDSLTSLSFKKRLIGFGISLGLGALFFVLAVATVGLILLKPGIFALFYTLGNVCLLASTFFIVGPLKQLKSMLQPTRLVASVVFVLALALTLFSAIYLRSWPLVLLSIIVQVCALVWYVISHIPYAQTCILNSLRGSVAV
eukprot:m51a1_g10767 hypothetical protein (167) ;mRNA; f:31837-32715